MEIQLLALDHINPPYAIETMSKVSKLRWKFLTKNAVNMISKIVKSTSVDGTDKTLNRTMGIGATKRRTRVKERRTKT
jgi:hypothetical protein